MSRQQKKQNYNRTLLKSVLLGTAILSLSACGGGSSSPTPVPTTPNQNPTPTPAPPPPTPSDHPTNTAEYRQNWGLGAIRPLEAYEQGGDGEGIIIGVIDSGVDSDHSDLVGRIHPDSRDVSSSRTGTDKTIEDIDGHGTFVAGIIGANYNEIGTIGVAYKSSVLVLRADEGTSCTDEPDDPDEDTACDFPDPDIAAGIDHAISVGAKIINLSLGGSAASGVLVNALRRAANAGILIVISAGNEGLSNPDAMALEGLTAELRGHVMIVGATDDTNTIADFSNNAGSGRDIYVVAPGVAVRAPYIGNSLGEGDGTSFAAPHVSGAAAILLQLFPNLTAPDVLDLLTTTATDLGTTGVDNVYGWGLINLEEAIKPQGAQSLPIRVVDGDSQNIPMAPTGIDLSPAFGDALGVSPLNNVMMVDGYNRSYMINLANRIDRPRAGISLAHVLSERQAYQALGLDIGDKGGFQVNLYDNNWQKRHLVNALPQSMKSQLNHDVGYAHFTANPTPSTKFSITKGMAWSNLGGGAKARKTFMSRGLFGESFLSFGQSKTQLNLSQSLDDKTDLTIGTSFANYRGNKAQSFDTRDIDASVTTAYTSLTHWGKLAGKNFTLGIQAGAMTEKNAMLGSISDGALSMASGANTVFTRVEGTIELGNNLSLTGTFSHGWTKPEGTNTSFISNISRFRTMSFGAAVLKENLISENDRLGFAVASPLRVESGKIGFTLPTNRDYTRDEILFSNYQTSLTPTKRELDFEISYQFKGFKRWTLEANILHQINAGHSRLWGDVTTAAIKVRTHF